MLHGMNRGAMANEALLNIIGEEDEDEEDGDP